MTQQDLTPQMAQENYDLLSPIEHSVLQFLSVLKEPIHRTTLAKHLKDAGILGDDGRSMSILALTQIIDRMVDLKLVATEGQPANQFYCVASIAAHATRSAIAAGRFQQIASVIQKELPFSCNYVHSVPKRFASFARCLRDLRIAVFSHDSQQVTKLLQICREKFQDELRLSRPFVTLCAAPFDAEWFRELPSAIQVDALEEIVLYRLENFESVADILPMLHELRYHPDETHAVRFRKQLVTILIFRGHLEEAQEILCANESVQDVLSLRGWIHFLRGENQQAIRMFELLMGIVKNKAYQRNIIIGELSGVFLLLALLKSGDPVHHTQCADFLLAVHKNTETPFLPILRSLKAVLLARQGMVADALFLLDARVTSEWGTLRSAGLIESERDLRLVKLFKAIVRFWINTDHASKHNRGLLEMFTYAMCHGQQWAAMETASLIAASDTGSGSAPYAEHAAVIQQKTGMHSLLPIVSREERWERVLKALIDMGSTDDSNEQVKTDVNSRLVWLIGISGNYVNIIQPKEQTRSAAGNWSRGRVVASRSIFQGSHPAFFTDQDRQICAAIVRDNNRFAVSWSRAMLAMVGHPLVFWDASPSTNVEVVKAEAELLVVQEDGQVTIRFADPVEREGVIAIQETPTRCKLIEITKEHKRIADLLGDKGLRVPVKAKDQVMQAIQAVSSLVTIHSGIGGGMANIEEIPADATPHIHLLPLGDGLLVNLLVRPFAGDGPYFQPGRGGKTIVVKINGKRVQTNRNLQDEIQRAAVVVAAASTVLNTEDDEWVLEDPEHCLELLVNLQTVADQVVVAWPEGEKMRVGRPVAMDNMRVRIHREHDWFSVTGELQVDESLVMGLGQLLDLVRDKESRFVPLGEGKFLALTEAFRKRLAEIDSFSEKDAKGRRFHPLAGSVFRELFEGVGTVEADSHWKAHLKRIDKAQSIDPALPSTLRAELRDYQVVGFRWLVRLADWGVGACLADDMGLGKTIQALALLLYRAQEGPSLVVAPTSVGLNWLGEIDRFAPTLNGIVFGSGQRQQTLDVLKPFDVVICSYGLLQQESEMLAAVRWNVIVLDEAQAIKNRLTKRSQAAMALTGSFRVATTGTPVENHLGELWNLFQFLNPGLLGSLETFNERFAAPIERQGDKGAQKRLRKLIQPFLLRRLKSQVLEELPSRTEIVLHVELTPEEMAFYETLRRKAIENIESLDGPAEQKRFQVLAELMRLRRACCNSRLVLPDSPIESSKLAIFWEVVEELLENRHKALVFSQFVDHLSIIRALLDEKKIAYQYLDGSTPAKERKRRVDAFQAGEGDLFLISLRAGGMGINLTAADYVIHMDPWWNPAVEDQASDRAHRIGQLRPVTIYRLVTKETIEEKIVDLHRHKRDLADGLLEGGEMSGKLSVDDLLNMIRGRE